MDISQLAEGFFNLFDGMKRAHGIYSGISEEPSREDGKRLGRIRKTVHEPVTVELFKSHLEGKDGLGIIPIREDNTARFGCLDLDVYDGLNHHQIAKKLAHLKLPLIVCRSKSGGAHIYLFAKEPVAAVKMVARLKEIAALIGHGSCEIFPKQTELSENPADAGSWINAPYFNGLMGGRYALRAEDGEAFDLQEFLDHSAEISQPAAFFDRQIVTSVDLPQGPPCLQHLVQLGFPQGTRNKGLYNLAIYAKKVDDQNWEDIVWEYNKKYMDPPLEREEVGTILKSLRKKEYRYSCNDQPLVAHCNSALCRSRKFGVGSAASSMPEFGRLRKLMTTPPLWFWDVGGKPLELTTEQLQDPKMFQRRCMEVLNIVPATCKRDVWEQVLGGAMSDIDEIQVPAVASPEGQFIELLEKYCTGRAQAQSRDELLMGKPWTSEGRTHFMLLPLEQFLDRNKFKDLKKNQILNVIREMGGEHVQTSIKGKHVNYWSVPEFAQQTEGHELPKSLLDEEKPF